MQALISFFFQLCLLRRAPQDLPASDALFWVTVAADLGSGLLVGLVSGLGLGLGLAQGITELVMLLGLLYAGLYFTGHRGRFTQSATALFGSGALIGLIAVVPLALNPTGDEESDAATLAALGLLVLVAWSVLVTGHIVRHTFGISLSQGVAVAIGFEILAITVIGALFGG